LHSLGGLIGALVAPAFRSGPRTPEHADEERQVGPIWSRLSASGLFWLALLIIVILTTLGATAYFTLATDGDTFDLPDIATGGRITEGLLTAGIALIFGMPALELLAAFLVALVLATTPRPDKRRQFWHLGKIVIGIAAGTAVGIGIMVSLVLFLTWVVRGPV
jgi:hypothetical protein